MIVPLGIEREAPRTPWGTYALMALCTFVYWRTSQTSQWVFRPFYADPNDLRLETSVTATLLHANGAHLFGNMLFLWIFGPVVEDRVGGVRMVALFFLCAFAGKVLYAIDPDSRYPSLGASGGVAGLMGIVLFSDPRARMRVLFWKSPLARLYRWPAWIYLFLWILGQSWLALRGGGRINVHAHIGGFGAGLLLQMLLRQPLFAGTRWAIVGGTGPDPRGPKLRELEAQASVQRYLAARRRRGA